MKKEIYICLQCGSINTKEVIGLRYTPATRKCIDCNNIGVFPLISKNKIKGFQRRIKKKRWIHRKI